MKQASVIAFQFGLCNSRFPSLARTMSAGGVTDFRFVHSFICSPQFSIILPTQLISAQPQCLSVWHLPLHYYYSVGCLMLVVVVVVSRVSSKISFCAIVIKRDCEGWLAGKIVVVVNLCLE